MVKKSNNSELRTFRGEPFSPAMLPYQSFRDVFFAARQDQRTFIKYYQGHDLVSTLSYAEFLRAAEERAKELKSRILDQELYCAALAMDNSDQLLINYAALMLIGAAIVPINPRESEAYRRTVLAHSGAQILITEDEILLLPALGPGTSKEPRDRSIAAIFYTSGTTSQPKGVALEQKHLLLNATALMKVHELSKSSVHLCVLPLFHVNAFGFSFLTTLLAGGCLILQRRFQKDSFWPLIDKEKVEITSLVPEVIRQLCEEAQGSEFERPRHLKYAVSAASALSKSQAATFYKTFRTRVLQGYGLSETVNFSLQTPNSVTDTAYKSLMFDQQRPSAGTPVWGNDVFVMSLTDARLLAPGETGEIVVRGWNIMRGYHRASELDESAFLHDWFHTGDLGYYLLDESGQPFFYLVGRLKEVAKRNSETVYLEEIEDQVKAVKGCSQSAVVAFPHARTGQEIGLVIVPNADTPPLQAIKSTLRKTFSNAKCPKVILFSDTLPRTGSHKIQRRFLEPLFKDYFTTNFSVHGHG